MSIVIELPTLESLRDEQRALRAELERLRRRLNRQLALEFAVDAAAATDVVTLAFRRDALAELIADQPEVGLVLVRNAATALRRRNVRLQALWLMELQRVVDDVARRHGSTWTPHSSW